MFYKKETFFKNLKPGKKMRYLRELHHFVNTFDDNGVTCYVFKRWSNRWHKYIYKCIQNWELEIEVDAGCWRTVKNAKQRIKQQ